jgi:UDP-glucose 4-epimerase
VQCASLGPSAAVVGADGFIGRHLTSALQDQGGRVTTFTREHEPSWLADTATPEIVFYLASSITPALAEQNPDLVVADHQGLAELLCRLAHGRRPPTVVLTSSAGTVYDPDVVGPCAEDAPTRATSRYGAAKLALERLLLEHSFTIPSVILRLSNVYGVGQRTGKSQGVLAYWLASALRGEPVQLIGDPQTTRDYVHVDDVVDCMLRVATRLPDLVAQRPVILNVASGRRTSLVDLHSIVELVVGREVPVQLRPGRAVDRKDTHLDVRLARQRLGWHAQTSLLDGITAMWQATRADDQYLSTPAGAAVGMLRR